jgi:hypothetical protein
MNLQKKWKQLKNSDLDSSGLNTLRLSDNCILELYVGLDENEYRYLLLHLPDTYEPNIHKLENENITLTYFSNQQLIAIKLLDNDFGDLFDDLIHSMLTSIGNESNAEFASKKFVDSFVKWNQFFRKLENRTYGEASILGFWGEMFTLYNMVKDKSNDYEINIIVDAWKGPLDSVHDFVFNDKSIEIKTKLKSNTRINVSSEFQLEADSVDQLELWVVNVEKADDGLDIEGLYKLIKAHILKYNGDVALLISRLLAFRLGESGLSKYNSYIYKPFKTDCYDCLQTDFPKIICSNIREELSSVKYKLDVSTLGKFILNTEKY